MEVTAMKIQLNVLSDLSELIPYSISDFPLYVGVGELKNFYKYTTTCHWHPDLEFAWMLKGNMNYFINGKIYQIFEGQGIFINSKRLHYNYSSTQSDCAYLVMTVNPFVFESGLSSLLIYMEEKFGSSNEDVIHFTNQEPWHDAIFQNVNQVFKEVSEKGGDVLHIISIVFMICSTIRSKIKYVKNEQIDEDHWMIVWRMIGFIHKNFSQKILLDDIAKAGAVCRTKCCELFNKYQSRTPGVYLMEYRIQKSCEMLRDTSCSIIEVASSCGFQSVSYYIHIFRKEIGYTPREYRETFKKSEKVK